MFICLKLCSHEDCSTILVCIRNNIHHCFKANNELFLYTQNIDEETSTGYETVSWTEISTFYYHLTGILRFPLKIKSHEGLSQASLPIKFQNFYIN